MCQSTGRKTDVCRTLTADDSNPSHMSLTVSFSRRPGYASGPRQTDCNLSSFFRARWTFSRMSEAVAVQMNGLGFWL